VIALCLCIGCFEPPAITFDEAERAKIQRLLWQDPPTDTSNQYQENPQAQRLGQWLFYETSLSRNGSVSCATCHVPFLAFTDGRRLPQAAQQGTRNTPTVLNGAHQRWFFWDGRRDSLWSQALEPFEDEKEFAHTRLGVLHAFAQHRRAVALYEKVFEPFPDLSDRQRYPDQARPLPDQPDHPHHVAWLTMSNADQIRINRAFANLGKAIAAYESLLVSRNSRFDYFARALLGMADGDIEALGVPERRGLKLFIGEANCNLCHFGTNFSDGEFHNTGVPRRDGRIPDDPGRYQGLAEVASHLFNTASIFSDAPQGDRAQLLRGLNRDANQWGQMKTPTLRNVSQTAPYMHRGQMDNLEEVVDFYNTLDRQVFAGHHREPFLQPLGLDEQQVADLVAFLKALDGQFLPTHLMHPPRL
jgi:cytochrome c peroxidase